MTWKVKAYEAYQRIGFALAPFAPRVPGSDGGDTLILPPSGSGSVGDEAMLLATLDHLAEAGAGPVGILEALGMSGWHELRPPRSGLSIRIERVDRRWGAIRDLLSVVDRYRQVFVAGADVLDGYYSELGTERLVRLVRLFARRGREVTVLGFSLNGAVPPATVRALRKIPASVRLCARDALSKGRAEAAVGRPVELVADVAFLLPPDVGAPSVARAIAWAEEERRAGRIVLGLNGHADCVKQEADGQARLIHAYAEAVAALAGGTPGVSVVYVPHDSRAADVTIGEAVRERLPERLRPRFFLQPVTGSRAVKELCGSLDLALTGRMHLAIACLGRGVPVHCIPYQGKFEGLLQHFGLEGHVVPVGRLLDPPALADTLREAVAGRAGARSAIAGRLPAVVALARTNFPA